MTGSNGNGHLSWKWLAGVLLGIVGFFLALGITRVGKAESDNGRQDQEIVELRAHVNNIRAQLNNMDHKLDRLLERR